jgi:hypothetical protein
MPLRVTRALLQVLYLEQHPPPRTPNTLRELLGLIQVRAAGEATPRKRRVIDLHGAAHFADDPVRRVIAMNAAGDVVIEADVNANSFNFNPPSWDDCSIALLNVTGSRTLHGFEAFSCLRWEKLIVNVGTGDLIIAHQGPAPFDNRVFNETADAITIPAGGAVWLTRDFTIARWRTKIVDTL